MSFVCEPSKGYSTDWPLCHWRNEVHRVSRDYHFVEAARLISCGGVVIENFALRNVSFQSM